MVVSDMWHILFSAENRRRLNTAMICRPSGHHQLSRVSLLGKSRASLTTARHRGLAPPCFVRLGAAGQYYPSRHFLICWLDEAIQARTKPGAFFNDPSLRALVADYPFLGLTQREMVERQSKRHPDHFAEELTAADLGKSADALRAARRRMPASGGLIWLAGRGHLPDRRTALLSLADHLSAITAIKEYAA